jgi:hypothetical protein
VAQTRVLLARSGNICAYRGCARELVYAAINSKDQPKLVGKIAHISAASPGGPRYRPELSEAERNSSDNLMFLCGDHHDVVDSQEHAHPEEALLAMKREHEDAVRRAVLVATGDVSYKELGLICSVVATNTADDRTSLTLPITVANKLEKNKLTAATRQAIETGLTRSSMVEDFLAFQAQHNTNFEAALLARFKADYFTARAELVNPDDIFARVRAIAVERAGIPASVELQAAALALVAYVFEICEIFES